MTIYDKSIEDTHVGLLNGLAVAVCEEVAPSLHSTSSRATTVVVAEGARTQACKGCWWCEGDEGEVY